MRLFGAAAAPRAARRAKKTAHARAHTHVHALVQAAREEALALLLDRRVALLFVCGRVLRGERKKRRDGKSNRCARPAGRSRALGLEAMLLLSRAQPQPIGRGRECARRHALQQERAHSPAASGCRRRPKTWRPASRAACRKSPCTSACCVRRCCARLAGAAERGAPASEQKTHNGAPAPPKQQQQRASAAAPHATHAQTQRTLTCMGGRGCLSASDPPMLAGSL